MIFQEMSTWWRSCFQCLSSSWTSLAWFGLNSKYFKDHAKAYFNRRLRSPIGPEARRLDRDSGKEQRWNDRTAGKRSDTRWVSRRIWAAEKRAAGRYLLYMTESIHISSSLSSLIDFLTSKSVGSASSSSACAGLLLWMQGALLVVSRCGRIEI